MTENEIYQSLEKAIFDHRLQPGMRLQEIKLSDIYKVKRGLIRKVLTRLNHAKLVTIETNKGAQVACPTLKEGKDLFATRQILELAVVEHLCKNINSNQIKHLYNLLDHEESCYQQNNIDEGKKLSADFHRELARITKNEVLISYLNDIINRTPLFMLTHGSHSNNTGCINHEHRDLVKAIESKNSSHAKELMAAHIEHLSDMFNHEVETSSDDLTDILFKR